MRKHQKKEAFLTILRSCWSPDNSIRKQSESQLKIIRITNYEDILKYCSIIFIDELQSISIRQLCSTIIKNYWTDTQGKSQWSQCPITTLNMLKTNSLVCWGSKISEIRKASAMLVAALAKKTIKISNWPDLISILYNAITHNNINYILTGIITLGEVCEEVKVDDFTQVDQEIIADIYKKIIWFDNLELLQEGLKAVIKGISYFHTYMKDANFKQFLYSRFCDIIIDREIKYDINVKMWSMKCINEFTNEYYSLIEMELELLMPLISTVIKGSNETLAIQGYMFLITIASEEVSVLNNTNKQSFKICQKYNDLIWNDIQYTLKTSKLEDEFTSYTAVSYLMERLSKCTDFNFTNKVLMYMDNCFKCQNSTAKVNAIYAFTSILDTIHTNEIRSIIPSSIPIIVKMLNECNSEQWQYHISCCLNRIVEIHSVIFIQNQNIFHAMIKALFSDVLNNYSNRVVSQWLQMWHKLLKVLKSFNEESLFDEYLPPMLQSFLNLANKKESYDIENNVSWYAFIVIGTLIETSTPRNSQRIIDFFPIVFDELLKSHNRMNYVTDQMQFDFQNYLCDIVLAYWTMDKIPLDKTKGEAIYLSVKQCFIIRGAMFYEGILVCSSWFVIWKNDLDHLIPDIIYYLQYGIDNYEDYNTCCRVMYALSDIIRGCEWSFLPYLKQIFPKLVDISKNNDTDRALRLSVFVVYTDMFVIYPHDIWDYFPDIMEILKTAFDTVVIDDDRNDLDLQEYNINYHETLTECISSVIGVIKERNKKNEFEQYLENSMKYVNAIVSGKYEFDVSQIAEIGGWITDWIDIYGKDMKNHINEKNIKYIINRLKKDKNKTLHNLASWLHQKVLNCKW